MPEIKNVQIFRAGKYPTQGLQFDENDLKKMVEEFKQVPLGIEFLPSVMDGNLGTVDRIYLGDSETIKADFCSVPDWVNDALPKDSFKAAVSIDRKTKKIVGVSLVAAPLLPEPDSDEPIIVEEDGNV